VVRSRLLNLTIIEALPGKERGAVPAPEDDTEDGAMESI